MEWLIPFLLFLGCLVFWRLSHEAKDALVAWCRFLLAVFLLLLAVVYAAVLAFA